MQTFIFILALAILASALPKPSKIYFSNLYKQPKSEIKVKPHPRIIGGHEAKPHSLPYEALLEIYSPGKAAYCGGSLISPNYILTAAHCVVNATEAQVTLGAHKSLVEEDTQIHLLSKELTAHEDFDSYYILNDIGVVKLPTPVTYTDAIQPIALPSRADADNTYQGKIGSIAGWGLTDGYGTTVAEVLNIVEVEILTNSECGEYYEELPDYNVCTFGIDDDKVGSVCDGDSGGPLVVGAVQIGIVSFVVVHCLPGWPDGYTRTASFFDWIEKHTDLQIK